MKSATFPNGKLLKDGINAIYKHAGVEDLGYLYINIVGDRIKFVAQHLGLVFASEFCLYNIENTFQVPDEVITFSVNANNLQQYTKYLSTKDEVYMTRDDAYLDFVAENKKGKKKSKIRLQAVLDDYKYKIFDGDIFPNNIKIDTKIFKDALNFVNTNEDRLDFTIEDNVLIMSQTNPSNTQVNEQSIVLDGDFEDAFSQFAGRFVKNFNDVVKFNDYVIMGFGDRMPCRLMMPIVEEEKAIGHLIYLFAPAFIQPKT